MDEKAYLISGAEEGSICIVTLMLTGRATPNLHNGIVNVGDEQHYVSFKHMYVYIRYVTAQSPGQ